MELAIPLVALAGLYFVSKKEEPPNSESFSGRGGRGGTQLPNIDIPNRIYPDEDNIVSQEN